MGNKTGFDILIIESNAFLLGKRWEVAGCTTFYFFLRILQKLSNILHPSRQNWTIEVCFFMQKENNSWKYLSQLLLTSYFILVFLNEKMVYSFYNSSMVLTHPLILSLIVFQEAVFTQAWKN